MFAIFVVILWHTSFLPNLARLAEGHFAPTLSWLIILIGYIVWWVGVPYFFITTGYFFRRSTEADGNILATWYRYELSLGWILLAWLCIYLVTPRNWPVEVINNGLWQPFYSAAQHNLELLRTQHIRLFLEGMRPVWHLWFLPALIVGLATLTLAIICRLEKYLVGLMIGLYVVIRKEELTGGIFFTSPLHFDAWMLAALLTITGWWLAGRERPSLMIAYSLIAGGFVLAMVEGMVLNSILHSSHQVIRDQTFLGGIVLGVGIFLLVLAKPKFGESTPLPYLARFTLGVYVSHIWVMYTLSPILGRIFGNWSLRDVPTALVIYACSVLLTTGLEKVPLVKYLVTKPNWRLG